MTPQEFAAEVLARLDAGLVAAEPALGRVFGRRRVALAVGCVQLARGLAGRRPAIEIKVSEPKGNGHG